jgi:hypothetical protein
VTLRRPSQVPRWAWGSSATLVQPPSGSAEAGFSTRTEPPAQWFNWQFNAYGAWIDFLRGPDVEKWERVVWPGTPATDHFNAPSRIAFDIDTTTSDTGQTAAAFRYACVGDTSAPAAKAFVSQRGNVWEARTNLPSSITGPYALKAIVSGRWLLGCLTGAGATAVYYGAADDGTAAGPMGAEGNTWTSSTLPGSPTEVKNFAQQRAGAKTVAACATEAMYSSDNGAAWSACTFTTSPSGNGRDVACDGSVYVWVSQDGEVFTSTDGVTFVASTTLAAGAGTWQLTAGATGELLAYRTGQTTAVDLYRSTDSGVSWTAVSQPSGSPTRITSVAYRDGVWFATGTRSPWAWVSNDLTSWRALSVPTAPSGSSVPPALYSVRWDGGRWVALGNGPALTCGRASDPADGSYVASDAPSTLSDAGSLRGLLLSTTAPTNGQALTWVSATSRWTPSTPSGGTTSPLTTNGDLWFYAGGVDSRLAVGSTAQVLTVAAGLPAWGSLPWASHTSTSVQTTDATQTTCGSYTVPNNSAVTAKLLVTGLKSDFTASCGWELTLTARNAGGTVTIEGGGAIIVGPTDGATTWSVTVDVSGTSLRLRVTGAAATTIDWTARWIVG